MQKNIVDNFIKSPPSLSELSSSLNLLAQEDLCICCIDENGKFLFSSCCVDFLYHRRHDALLSIIYEFVTSFHEKHYCSVKTMLSMFYLWFRHLTIFIQKGSHVFLFLELFQKVLDRITSHAETLAIDIIKSEPAPRLPSPYSKTPKLRFSRNMNETTEMDASVTSSEWNSIISGLCRNNVLFSSIMQKIFNNDNNSSTVDNIDVHVLPVRISCSRQSFTEKGFIFQVDDDSLLKLTQLNSIRLVLIRGSLHPTHKHVGLNQSLNVTHLFPSLHVAENASKSGNILFKILHRIQHHSVNVLLSTDPLSSSLQTLLDDRSIVCIQPVSFDVLRLLERKLNIEIIEYYLDICADTVSRELPLELLDIGLQSSSHFVKLLIPDMFSVILFHPVAPYHAYLEDRFNHCLQRVRNAIRTCKVLPGQGHAEQSLISFLSDDTQWTDLIFVPYFSEVRELFIDSFQSYVRCCNRHGCTSSEPFYDDLQSKLAAWETAASAVSVIARTRCQVSSVRAEDCPNVLNFKSCF